jgi:hypothetical protein
MAALAPPTSAARSLAHLCQGITSGRLNYLEGLCRGLAGVNALRMRASDGILRGLARRRSHFYCVILSKLAMPA